MVLAHNAVATAAAIGVGWFGQALADLDPRPALTVVLLLAVGAGRRTTRTSRWRRRDPVRWFPPPVRATARAWAGGRCEYLRLLGRCPRPARETDHFVPWARGGATSQANAVASCRQHNQRKGARPPSWLDTAGLWWRRRTYYPAGVPRRPGRHYHPLPCRPARRSTP